MANAWQRLRTIPVAGRVADWGMGRRAVSRRTERAGARIAGLKTTESVCPYCAVGCGQVVYTRGGELVDIGLEPACAKACPTDSIQFGPYDELLEVAARRVATLHERGIDGAYLRRAPRSNASKRGRWPPSCCCRS